MIKVKVSVGKNNGDVDVNLPDFLIESTQDSQINILLPSGEKIHIKARYLDSFKMFVFYSVSLDEKLLLSLNSFYLNHNEILLSSVTVKTPKDLLLTFMFDIED